MDRFVYCLLLFMPDIKETKNTFFSKCILFNQNSKTSKKKSNFCFTFLHVD